MAFSADSIAQIDDPWVQQRIRTIDVEGLYKISFCDLAVQPVSDDFHENLIFFSEAAAKIVMEVFSQFGFNRLPTTFLELVAVHELCGYYQSLWMGQRGTDMEEIVKTESLDFVENKMFDRLLAVRAYLNRDLALLSKIHEDGNWMEKAAIEYVERSAEADLVMQEIRESYSDRTYIL